MNVYAAATIVALSTAAGMFLADRIYVFCWWWRAMAAAERAEQQQPDAGLSLLNAPRHKQRRKSLANHFDVFPDDDAPDLIDAGRQMQSVRPEDLMDVFVEEIAQ